MGIAFNENVITLEYENSGVVNLSIGPGTFKVECWGASGGIPEGYDANGSRGAYVSGIITFGKQTNLYAYIGEQGSYSWQNASINNATFNGGGSGGIAFSNKNYGAGSGGGASDLRLIKSQWDDFQSLKSRIIVAGGGAGATFFSKIIPGGSGGSFNGEGGHLFGAFANITASYGGTQTSGGIGCKGNFSNGEDGRFGIGGNWGQTHCSSGGGGGYFGGGGGGISEYTHGSGAGGSSYVSGHPQCKSITKDSINSSISFRSETGHYSDLVFKKPIMIPGNETMFSPTHSIETGHRGNGCIIITKLHQTEFCTNFDEIVLSGHILSITFFWIVNEK